MLDFLKTWRIQLVLALVAVNFSSATAQTIIRNFSGVSYDGFTPPDSMGAAGTNHFVEFINGAFAIYSKDGVQQKRISDTTFWLNAGISSGTISAGLTDTRIIYDAGSGRWIATELTVDNTGNQILAGRSDTSDPGGTWKAVSFVGSSTNFSDFDTLGVDSTGVYVSVDDFDVFNNLTGVSMFSIPKSDLIADPPTLSRMTKFENLDVQVYGFSLQGVSNPDPGPGHGVIIAVDNATLKYVDRTTINGSGEASATLSARVRIHCTYDSYPNPAHQPGGATIDPGDDRFSAAVKQVGGYIFMANSVLQNNRDAVHWMVLNETNSTLIGEGLISDTTYDYFYPSIAANHNGRILLTFNRSGATSPAGDVSIYGVVGTLASGKVAMGPVFLIQAGTISNYTLSIDSPPYRWGDYSATMVDPTDEDLFWAIQEIPASSSSWGTQITLISLATNQPTLGITRAGDNIQLSWPLSTDPAYILQATTNLAAAAWTTVANAPVIAINQKVVTLQPASGMAYYRLAK